MHTTSAKRRAADADTTVTTLPNGLRFVALPLPHLQTASVGVYVRAGSAHEPRAPERHQPLRRAHGLQGHRARDVHRINLDAERLGAEVNAHTDKDHTAYYMRGRGEHAALFVQMLADIVQNATFPEAELARERDVLLQEAAEVADDPMDTAYQLFDHACWGLHPAAQAVIGPRRNIERLQRGPGALGVAALHRRPPRGRAPPARSTRSRSRARSRRLSAALPPGPAEAVARAGMAPAACARAGAAAARRTWCWASRSLRAATTTRPPRWPRPSSATA